MLNSKKSLRFVIYLLSLLLLINGTAIPTAGREEAGSLQNLNTTFPTGMDSDMSDENPEGESTVLAGEIEAIDGLNNKKRSEYENDGTFEERSAFMKEISSMNEKYQLSFQVAAEENISVSSMANILHSTDPANMPTKGTARVLAFLVEFPDMPHDENETVESAREAFFGENSLASFYRESSYEKLTIQGDVTDWYTATYARDYYVKNGIATLYEEVLNHFNSTIDYSVYDADQNGYIDGLYLHFSGENTGWGSTFWSYVTSIRQMNFDGLSIGERVCMLHTLEAETIRHESGHLLGLPDYYSYSIKTCNGNYSWVGSEDMMVAGSGDHNAVSKMMLGWIEETRLITQNGDGFSLRNIAEFPDSAVIYPFGENSGDSFFILQSAKTNVGIETKDCLRIFRVNAYTEVASDGEKFYKFSNMYGETPFIELIDDLFDGDTVDPYGNERTTHYYNLSNDTNVFSGITVTASDDADNDGNISFSLAFEDVPSRLGTPTVTTTAGVNEVIVSIDYDVPFLIDYGKAPYLLGSDGNKLADFTVKPILSENVFSIDRVMCNLPVASYATWEYIGGNEIIGGADIGYMLQAGREYTVVVPAGAFRTVLGTSEAFSFNITADSTAVKELDYKKISEFDRCSEYITLSDSRVAYAYVKSSALMLDIIDENGNSETFTVVESGMSGHVSICQLSDGTLAIGCDYRSTDNKFIGRYYKYSLTENKVLKTFEPDQESNRKNIFIASEEGFYIIRETFDSLSYARYIDNDLTDKKVVFTDYKGAGTYLYTDSAEGDLFFAKKSEYIEQYEYNDTIAIYKADGTKLKSGWSNELYNKGIIGVTTSHNGNILIACCDEDYNTIEILEFDLNLNLVKIIHPNIHTQKLREPVGFWHSAGIQKVGEGYLLEYTYVRQYNPHGNLVGFFNTETWQEGILLDKNFNAKSVFDVTYETSAAAVGKNNRYIVGDEYGFYTIEAELEAVSEGIFLKSDKYMVDNENQTITGVPEGTIGEELIKFLQINTENAVFSLNYTHAIIDGEIPMTSELSCNYQLLVCTDGMTQKVYTFPELPKDKDSNYLVYPDGVMYGYIGNETEIVTPDFVKSIRLRTGYFESFKNVVSFKTAAENCYGKQNQCFFPKLKYAEFLEGSKYVHEYFLYNCPLLEKVVLADTVEEIGSNAFSYLKKIKSIVIPVSVRRIYGNAFTGIQNKEANDFKVEYLGTKELWEQIDFHMWSFGDFMYDWQTDIGNDIIYSGAGIACPAVPLLSISDVVTSNGQIFVFVEKTLFEDYGYGSPYLEICIDRESAELIDTYTVSGDYYVFQYTPNADWNEKSIGMTLHAWQRGVPCEINYTENGENAAYTIGKTPVKIKSASLTLENSLQINYMVAKSLFTENGYKNPYIIFKHGEVETKVVNYTESEDSYIFSYTNISPASMNDTICATLYVSVGDTVLQSSTVEYSVARYCYNMLSKCSSDEYTRLRTLLVDLLNYGAATQLFTGYKVESLVNENLTEEQRAWATNGDLTLNTVFNKAFEVVENPSASFTAAGLVLNKSIELYVRLKTEDITGLSVKITSSSGTSVISASEFVKTETTEGVYYDVYFNELTPLQRSDALYITVYKNETAVSDTLCYSIESYAFSKQKDENLAVLVNAMMKYCNSAYAYVN